MIAILSKESLEGSTEDVIDWLDYYKADYVRINGESFFKDVIFQDECFKIKDLEKINICWFRRWVSDEFLKDFLSQSNLSNRNILELFGHLNYEKNAVNFLLWETLSTKKWLTNPLNHNKKLHTLKVAQEIGFIVPKTIITSKKSSLIQFHKNYQRIITKSITDTPFFFDEDTFRTLKTTEIFQEDITNYSDVFFPSLFQELIEKDYEIRVFFLEKEIYSMAIFSQLDESTSIDFRNYNYQKPNRCVPYNLPSFMKKKIHNISKALNINTGSIDIIKSKDGNYVFLEINQVGQFGMTSYPCNFFLENQIAKYLIKNDK